MTTPIEALELKCCPFCGGEAILSIAPNGVAGRIYCGNEDCFGPKTTAAFKADAIKQWNTRATASLEGDAVERVARIIFFVANDGIEHDMPANVHRWLAWKDDPSSAEYWQAARAILATGLVAGKAEKDAAFDPTDVQINSACLSFRHDYGLLDDHDRERLRFVAVEWLRAWQKEGFGSDRDEIIERCAAVVDQCNREGPYQAIGAAAKIRALKTDATIAPDKACTEFDRAFATARTPAAIRGAEKSK